MDLKQINQIAQQLIDALNANRDANINLLGVQRRNFFEDTMNRAASRGTLYSTGGRAQQLRYEGVNYLPAVAEQQSKTQQQILNTRSSLLDTQRKINAQKRAASELNNISFQHLLD